MSSTGRSRARPDHDDTAVRSSPGSGEGRPPVPPAAATLGEQLRPLIAIVAAAIAACVLPLIHDYEPLVRGSIVARGVMAGCVAGLVCAAVRPRWVGAAVAAAGTAIGVLLVGLADRAYFDAAGLALGVVCAAAVALGLGALSSVKWRLAAEVAALGAVLLVALWFAGVLPGALADGPRQARSADVATVPQPEQYGFDGLDYLRTYHLMKQGMGFYDAFKQGQIEDARHDATFLTSPFNYREPFLFEVWRLLPGSNGGDLLDWFIVWSLVALVVTYLLASSLTEPGPALLASVCLIPFLFYLWWTSTWFLSAEIWAAPLGVAAVACLLRRWRIAGLVLLIAAVATRELMVLLVPAWLVGWGIADRGRLRSTWWVPAVAVLGPAVVLGAHVLAVPPLATGGSGIAGWLHGGPSHLLAALRFGWQVVPHGAWVPLTAAAAAIVAAVIALPRWRMAALLAATLLPPLFLLVAGSGPWDYYWGAVYTPLAVAVAPGIVGRLLPPRSRLFPLGVEADPGITARPGRT